MSLDEAARGFVKLLEQLSFPYAIMGGLAVRIHALPRPTFDVDFTALIPRDQLSHLYAEAEAIGLSIPAAQATGWIDTVRGMPVIKFHWPLEQSVIDLDLFLAETPFQRQLLARRQRHAAEGWEAWFVTAEDLVLLKLLAGRPKDLTDVADILFIQGQLDDSYLKTWARNLGIEEALSRALEGAAG